ncbi:MAG: AEC family transporter [Lachnospiraceae bacterium]|nr:AEC family transporter [Lachnospiraceae bacterium]
MENLIISFNVVLPLFLCMALGYFLKRIKLYDDATLKTINKLVFKVFLPIYLFKSVYSTDLSAAFNGKLILFAVIGLVAWFLLLMLIVPMMEKENSKRGVMVQAMFRSNFVLYGLPVATSLCGEENIGATSLLIGIVVPIFNVLAVITLETFRGGKPSVKKMAKGIATNPLIIASVIGIAFYFLNIKLPSAVEKTVTDLSRVATPLALVALGGEFKFSKIKGNLRQLIISVIGKLVVSPLIIVAVGIMLGFRDETLVPVLLMSGAPAAVSSYTMAQQMGGDGELAGEIVIFTTGISILTIFLWVFGLKQLGFI